MRSPLETSAISTFETLALLFAEAEPGHPSSPSLSSSASRDVALAHAMCVRFTGVGADAFDGALVVAVSDDVARALAGNMLGVAPAQADVQARRDALGEVTNVVCGNVLPLLGGRRAVFHLGAPHPVPLAAVDALADAGGVPHGPARRERLVVESGAAVVALFAPDHRLHAERPAPGRCMFAAEAA